MADLMLSGLRSLPTFPLFPPSNERIMNWLATTVQCCNLPNQPDCSKQAPAALIAQSSASTPPPIDLRFTVQTLINTALASQLARPIDVTTRR